MLGKSIRQTDRQTDRQTFIPDPGPYKQKKAHTCTK